MFLYFWQYLNLADRKGVSRELALHPVHLTPDKDGNLPPSAFVPFCSYQGNNNLRGQERSELENLSMCDEFEPIILEGQLCFSLALRKSGGKVAKSGKTNGLLLLLDPSPYQLNTTDRKARGSRTEEQSFKVFIHTLEPHTIFGPGSYGMSTLRKKTKSCHWRRVTTTSKGNMSSILPSTPTTNNWVKCMFMILWCLFVSATLLEHGPLQAVYIYFDTATFDEIERDEKVFWFTSCL